MSNAPPDTPSSAQQPPDDAHAPADFPVVGIGASAGGLDAFAQFFECLPEAPGMAFILVQHLVPHHESELAELLQNHTAMRVDQVEGTPEVRPDHIYVIPPGKLLSIREGRLHLSEIPPGPGRHLSIDHFFRTLAEDQGERAVCIILSGTGSDGTQGLKAVKEHAGVAMAQAPSSAEYDGMPQSAIRTNLVDVTGTPQELAEKLVGYRKTAAQMHLPGKKEALSREGAQALAEIFDLLHRETGHDFKEYKQSTMLRRIGRRMTVNQIERLPDYRDYLRAYPREADALLKDFLISVTSFFRDPEAFEALEREVIPRLFQRANDQEPIRVWVPGCATGEEAYSIAMLLHEYAEASGRTHGIQIFATDLDEDAIALARVGRYPDAIAADLAPGQLERFFTEEFTHHGYRVREEIREMVLFSSHNLIDDPPFSQLDLISCRNLLIYLNHEVQQKVYELFHYALREGGYLFLGQSEKADSNATLFEPLDKKCRIFRRRDHDASPAYFPMLSRLGDEPERRATNPEAPSLETRYQDWTLQRYAPPRLLVNADYELTHTFGGAGSYLIDPEGPATHDVLERILPPLRAELRLGLHQVFHKGEATDSRFLRVEVGGEERHVRLHVGPVEIPDFPANYAEVVFLEVASAHLYALDLERGEENTENVVIVHLEDELQRTRERLQATIQDQEASKEELKASNEELRSMNEELQLTTEELETSKEELQSMNEELITVNQELKTKIKELNRANSDLQNLMASTEVGTIFLDRHLHLKRYTPRVTELFHVAPADLGRPFEHVAHRLDHDHLPEVARRVLQDLTPVEEEVRDQEGRWFILRAMPYRTLDDHIDGIVFTFVEVTRLKQAQQELSRRVRQQAAVADLGRMALEGLPLPDLKDIVARKVTQVMEAPLCEILVFEPEADALRLEAGLGWKDGYVGTATVETRRGSQAGFTLQQDETVITENLDDEDRFVPPDLLTEHDAVSGMTVVIPGTGERPYGVLGVHDRRPRTLTKKDGQFLQGVANVLAEAIERKQAEATLRENERTILEQLAEIESIYNTAPVGMSFLDADLRFVRVNERLAEIDGLPVQKHLGRPIDEVLPDLAPAFRPPLQQALATGEPIFDVELQGTTPADPDKTRYWIANYHPLRGEDAAILGINCVIWEVTEIKEMEQELRTFNETLEERVREQTKKVRRLASDLTMAEQRERRRIAQILHDELQQQLYGLQIKMQMIEDDVTPEETPQGLRDLFASARQLIERALHTARTLTVNLSPPILDEEGLADSLRWLVLQMRDTYNLAVTLEDESEDGAWMPSQELRVLLFQLVRELLFNVVKHAEVDEATLRLHREAGALTMQVEDHGAGFDVEDVLDRTDPQATADASGFGLLSVRERLRFVGGHLDVDSIPGDGTCITLHLPRPPSEDVS